MLREEELRWYQRSKSNFILKGYANTKYFQNVANGRHRKKSIHTLNQDEGLIESQQQLKAYITSYYKGLFDAQVDDILSMDETRTDDIPQVSNEENTFLNSPFTEEEIKRAVFQMEHNKAPRPDDFPAKFYQHFWDAIKTDLIELFQCWHAGQLD